jgi:hypothetical protein
VYTVVTVGDTCSVPLVALVPVKLPPVAVQVVALVVVHVSVLDCPEVIAAGLGVSVTVGAATGATVTVTVRLPDPPGPVQVKVYCVVVVGDTCSVPLIPREPLQPWLAVQVVALVVVQVSVLACPEVIEAGLGVSVTTGAGMVVTVTVAERLRDPPGPVQLRLYWVVLVGDTCSEPLVGLVPVKVPPLALQVVALVALQVSVLDCPEVITAGLGVSETVGVGGAPTVTVTDFVVVPPIPPQARA